MLCITLNRMNEAVLTWPDGREARILIADSDKAPGSCPVVIDAPIECRVHRTNRRVREGVPA